MINKILTVIKKGQKISKLLLFVYNKQEAEMHKVVVIIIYQHFVRKFNLIFIFKDI